MSVLYRLYQNNNKKNMKVTSAWHIQEAPKNTVLPEPQEDEGENNIRTHSGHESHVRLRRLKARR